MKNNKQIQFYVDKTVVELFQRKYPNCMSQVLRHCLYACVNRKEIFDKLFFEVRETILDSSKNVSNSDFYLNEV